MEKVSRREFKAMVDRLVLAHNALICACGHPYSTPQTIVEATNEMSAARRELLKAFDAVTKETTEQGQDGERAS